jgi:putative DNA primase/helicase
MRFDEILSRFPNAKRNSTGYVAKCPAHDDRNPSLSISEGNGGATLLHCHAGCAIDAVCSAVGLNRGDLFANRTATRGGSFNIVTTYDYHDGEGNLLFQVCRLDPKDFRQRHPDGKGGWIWKMDGVERVLFHLPELLAAKAAGRPIYICEGEKDVLAAEKAGFAATCNPGGAGKWLASYTETLRGADVVIVADKDEAGRKHAQLVASNLNSVASSVRVVELPDTNGKSVKDAADYFTAGGDASGLDEIAQAAPIWVPSEKQYSGVTAEYLGSTDKLSEDESSDHFKSDIGYADAFVRRYADSIRFCADEEIWLVFDEAHGWRRDDTGKIESLITEYARELYRKALETAKTKDLEEGRRIINSMASLGNSKKITPALKFASIDQKIVVMAKDLDADAFLVGVEIGVVNLRDGTFQSHCREHLVTRRLSVRFDSAATAPTWEHFLMQVQPDCEMREFLQRLSGYSLTGEIREHILPFHFGVGANGKGTFLEHALLKLAGNYGAKLTDDLVYASKRGSLPHLEIANLCGKRFALGEENSEGGQLNEAVLKAITGGDKVKGRFHYGNFVEYFPTYKIALVGNHKPRISGTDDGIWRRFLLVDWPVKIPKEKQDATLKDKLAAELPGILNWCIAGAQSWLSVGLNPPKSCLVATGAFRESSDELGEFIAEHFEQSDDDFCTKSDAFNTYSQWAGSNGIKFPLSKRGLGIQLINRGWREFRSSHGNSHCWAGVRLKNP